MPGILALDLSTSIGWAVLDEKETVLDYGTIATAKPVLSYGLYPWCYLFMADELALHILGLVDRLKPTSVIIEETNLGKSRYAQKALEFIHSAVLRTLIRTHRGWVRYVSSSAWRRALNLQLTAEDRRANGKLSKAKRRAKDMNTKLDKKALGVRGRVGKKHLSVRWVNNTYNLGLKMKDDDIADAICLGVGFLRGAETCTGE